MLSPSVLLASLVALNAVPTTQAQSVKDTVNDDDHFLLNTNRQRQIFASPNATLSEKQNVTGYDLSRKWPSTEVNGWTFTVSIVGDKVYDEERRLTAAQLNYTRPASLPGNATWPNGANGWGSCGTFSYVEYNIDADVDPGCKGVLSDECRDALRKQVIEDGTSCVAPSSVPDECEDELKGDDDENRLLGFVSTNATSTSWIAAGVLHKAGEFEYYDKLVTRVFVTTFGFFNKDEKGAPETDGEKIPGVLNCARVDKLESGSRSADEAAKAIEEGSAGITGPSMVLVALTAAVAVMGLV